MTEKFVQYAPWLLSAITIYMTVLAGNTNTLGLSAFPF